jgi:predicted RNA-binding Zn ribbon-like protein
MSNTTTVRPPFEWIGGRMCLDFANTVSWAGDARVNERLATYADLVDWGVGAEILTEAAARRLLRAAARSPGAAEAVLRQAHALREAVHEIFSAQAARRDSRAGAPEALNLFLGQAMGRLRLDVMGDSCSWRFTDEGDELERVLWPVAWSAANLLTSGDLRRVRECVNERCGWLFVDQSKNHSRRWCDMKSCGNTAKARRHYARAHGGGKRQ